MNCLRNLASCGIAHSIGIENIIEFEQDYKMKNS
jgi:hypothetical protein